MADTTNINFQFGTIQLGFVKTTNYQEMTEFDPSGVNVTLVRHRITVRGVLARGLIPAESGEVAGDVLARLRRYILRARRYLLYGIAGKVIVEVGNSSSPDDPALNLDAANGPKCLWVTATDIAEGGIVIEASFEAAIVPCDGTARGILAHTFNQKEDYDSAGYCTLTTSGVIVTRSDLRVDADTLLKDAGIPKIRDGYKRIGKSFALSENGLKLMYQIQDREYHNRPPEGSIEADGQFAIVTGAGGNGAYANVDVTLLGFKDTLKRDLYLKAAEIANAKTRSIRQEDAKTGAPSQISATVTEDLFANRIKASFVVLADQNKIYANQKEGIGGWKPDLFGIGNAFRPDGKNIPERPLPTNVPEKYFDTSKPKKPELDRRQEVLRDGQLVDMIRAEFNEPCDDLAVIVQSPGKSRGGSGRLSTTESLLGTTGATDGGTPGGGGVPVAGSVLGGIFTQEQADAIGSGTTQDILRAFGLEPPAPADPLAFLTNDGREPSLTERFFPQAGGSPSDAPDPVFGSIGGNRVDNRTAPNPLSEPADIDLPYASYLVSIGHSYDSGKRGTRGVGPPNSQGVLPPNPVASVGNPSLVITAVWTAERIGARPQIPDPDSGDDNYVLMAANIKPDEVWRTPGGRLRYVVTGSYVYFVRRPAASPILDSYPPFLLGDVQADERAGIADPGYRTAKGILFARVRTLGSEPFFGKLAEPAPPEAPPVEIPPLVLGIVDSVAGGYNPSPGG